MLNLDTVLNNHGAGKQGYLNNKLDKHLTDNNAHITSTEREAWNNKLDKSGGTMTGILVAQNNTEYTTKQVRNIIISTTDPSGGGNGDIWIKYTP